MRRADLYIAVLGVNIRICRGQGRAPRVGPDLGDVMWLVGSRELCQPRTSAGGQARHGEQPEPCRPAQVTAVMSGQRSVDAHRLEGADQVDLVCHHLPHGVWETARQVADVSEFEDEGRIAGGGSVPALPRSGRALV